MRFVSFNRLRRKAYQFNMFRFAERLCKATSIWAPRVRYDDG